MSRDTFSITSAPLTSLAIVPREPAGPVLPGMRELAYPAGPIPDALSYEVFGVVLRPAIHLAVSSLVVKRPAGGWAVVPLSAFEVADLGAAI